MAEQTRTYADVSPDQVFTASGKIFTLADEWDFKMFREKRRLKASRSVSFLFMTAYNEGWEIQAIPVNGSTEVTVAVELAGRSGDKVYPRDMGVYHFFFARLEYLMGTSANWMICEQYEDQTRIKPDWAYDGFLCLHADDEVPDAP